MNKIITTLLAALTLTTIAHADKLVFKGSDTLGAKLVPQLAEAFKADNPSFSYEISAEGSTTGITALLDKTTDIAMASRPVKPTEVSAGAVKGVSFSPTVVAMDGIAVIVNNENTISGLTKKQIADIFTGTVTDWSDVGGKSGKISVYTRNNASGTFQEFKDMAMNKAEYVDTAQKLAGNEQIADEVGKNPNGVGYVGLAYIKATGVKAVSVGGIALTDETVRSAKYPYSRPTFFYTNGKATGLAKEFIDFVLGPKGAAIVSRVGFVPTK